MTNNNTSTGNRSTGDFSTGNRSTGNRSTGHCSTGDFSTGDFSTGCCSTGYRSTGNYSTGNWSVSDHSTGHFSTIDDTGFSVFNKPCTRGEWDKHDKPDFFYFCLTEWIESAKMSENEKNDNPSHTTTGGYLKTHEYKDAWRIAWDGADQSERKKTLDLPNFDADIFLEITGIDVRVELSDKVTLVCDGKTVEISRESARALGLIE